MRERGEAQELLVYFRNLPIKPSGLGRRNRTESLQMPAFEFDEMLPQPAAPDPYEMRRRFSLARQGKPAAQFLHQSPHLPDTRDKLLPPGTLKVVHLRV
jgi:hypothetical protein